ncbi:MAG: proton-conducting transporter membrane subunit [Gammaproteobacteria bacterium]|nr:proton-conducting transporter membrane subunit [Gammaproteobacteria bacterium]
MGITFIDFPWAIALILLPLTGGLSCFLWPSVSKILGLVTVIGVMLSATGLGWLVIDKGVYHYLVGGWGAPLGIELYVDGLSLLMLMVTALVALGVSIYSIHYFELSYQRRFWPLWLFLLTALNALFLSADIFNLYVTLELMGLAAVALATLTGSHDAFTAAMRYLLATLLGSLAFLFGVVLLYHSFGSLDIAVLSERFESNITAWAAFGLISAGLVLKTALFPMHFWLPPAHANAPAPVSAVLSALVVKASFYILLRLWLEIFSQLDTDVDILFGFLGSIAIIWGSLQALRQTRIKLLVAYSTVAQVGYLFLAFPLAEKVGVTAWSAAVYLILSHALAKSAMFLAAGNLLRFGGHDRIADLDRVAQRLPITVAAFALAGVSIMGLPPSGGFISKWLLLQSALVQSQWGLVGVMLIGGVLAAAYIFKVLGRAFTQAPLPHEPGVVPATMEWAALLLAGGAILLGFFASEILAIIEIGSPFGAGEVKL